MTGSTTMRFISLAGTPASPGKVLQWRHATQAPMRRVPHTSMVSAAHEG